MKYIFKEKSSNNHQSAISGVVHLDNPQFRYNGDREFG